MMTGTEKAMAFVLVGGGIVALLFAFQTLLGMLQRRPIAHLRIPTEKFREWKEQQHSWELPEKLLLDYIKETGGISPFEGDFYVEEAKKFALEQGIPEENMKIVWEESANKP